MYFCVKKNTKLEYQVKFFFSISFASFTTHASLYSWQYDINNNIIYCEYRSINSLKPTRHLWEHLKGKKVRQYYYKITSKTKEEENKQEKKGNLPWLTLYHSYTHLSGIFWSLSSLQRWNSILPFTTHTHTRAAPREVFSSRLCSLLQVTWCRCIIRPH